MKTISEFFGKTTPLHYTSEKHKPVEGLSIADPKLLYGVELEVEHVTMPLTARNTEGFGITNDGSLRNNGKEFVSLPMFLPQLVPLLHNLIDGKFTDENYSERTSVHVHCNVLNLNQEQLAAVCLLYQVVEPLLFNYIGEDRENNIFCVPWRDSSLTFHTVLQIQTTGDFTYSRCWRKYSALNLLPISTQGTIEFRHMAGTHDIDRIVDWCNIIGCLFAFARKHPLTLIKERVMSLNTTSEYGMFLSHLFGPWEPLLNSSDAREALEEGVVFAKYMQLDEKKFKNPQVKKRLNNVVFDDPLNEVLNNLRMEPHPVARINMPANWVLEEDANLAADREEP